MRPIVLLVLGCQVSFVSFGRDVEIPEQIEIIPGKIETYFTDGYLAKAEYINRIIEDAVVFYEEMLNDTFSFDLFVLDRKTWKQYAEEPFPVPHIITVEKRIIMPAYSFYKVRLPAGDSIYGKDCYYLSDFIAIHELGHYISQKQNARSFPEWSGEFFADFVQIAYMHQVIPEFVFENPAVKIFPYLPLKHKSLQKFGETGLINGLIYHAKFQELSNDLYLKHGFNFMYEYMQVYRMLNQDIDDGKFKNVTISDEMIYQKSIENIESIESDIFKIWHRSMRQTFHSWLVLFVLISLVAMIRLFDNSFSIFTSYQFTTKKIDSLLGVSATRIWYNLKHVKPGSIRVKLFMIGVLRIVNLFLVVALILCLIFMLS